ncbi:G-type lectin S-receptor-like serine/threonine-protein kinase LECRK3 [Carya illinoinensis]|uniref:G-type lectin S-receptor-like serine/threonine-protein kinase LECRK3 n=1 Tax=Carya illinoinensis TaxID=32201 RepID=UPI001C71960E|nr:G-type lectin S-receptor-like serine/threonine-protein kinase LECRK3 [Carya illinoinensis]
MLDSGNLVLATQNSVYLWECFNRPTDTILPTNTIGRLGKLVARYSETNYSNGRFQFSLQSVGNLMLQTIDFPLDSANSNYWSCETVGSGFPVVFNQSGSIYVAAVNESILKMISSNAGSTQDFYTVILEYDGVFRHYVYPEGHNISNSTSWPLDWIPMSNFIPSNICSDITEGTGGGACGFNSYCQLGDDQRPQFRKKKKKIL